MAWSPAQAKSHKRVVFTFSDSTSSHECQCHLNERKDCSNKGRFRAQNFSSHSQFFDGIPRSSRILVLRGSRPDTCSLRLAGAVLGTIAQGDRHGDEYGRRIQCESGCGAHGALSQGRSHPRRCAHARARRNWIAPAASGRPHHRDCRHGIVRAGLCGKETIAVEGIRNRKNRRSDDDATESDAI